MHIPWSSDIVNVTKHGLSALPGGHKSDAEDVALYNKTMPVGNGTLEVDPSANATTLDKQPKFAKVAVASGFEDILYEKALQTHIDHSERWGYPLYMARENAADGMFNKVAYIMTVLLNELYKPAENRVEWLFYFDVDSIVMNQHIPLEIFMPPSDFDHIHYLAGRDWNGLNAGVLMLRVSQWTLNLLTRTMTYKHYHPDADYTFEEQSIFAMLTEEDDEFKKEMIYVPRGWFNAYFYQLDEAKPGTFLSHFPHPDYKWHIYEWLKILDADKDDQYNAVYNKPLEQTDYPADIQKFWKVKRRVDKALKGFQRNIDRGADPIQFGKEHEETKKLAESFRKKYKELKEGSRFKTDNPDELDKLISETEEVSSLFRE